MKFHDISRPYIGLGAIGLSFALSVAAPACLAADLPDITLFGRVQLDSVFYGDWANEGDDGLTVRRARIGAKGALSDRLSFQVDLDVSGSAAPKLEDTFLRYQASDHTALTLGYNKIYHSLDAATSDADVPFMERSMVSSAFEVGAGGKWGVSALTSGKNWSLQYGVTLTDPNDTVGSKDGWGVGMRATYTPVLTPDHILHLGVSTYYRDESDNLVGFSEQPEVRKNGFKPFDSGIQVADHYRYMAVEAATEWKRLSVQAEYGGMRLAAPSAGPASYAGAYVAATYSLTGEQRPYDAGRGKFGHLQPLRSLGDGGPGAVELAARYSWLDLEDAEVGTRGHDITVGVNWYANTQVRLMANMVHFQSENMVDHSVSDGWVYGLRAQAKW
ncbi:OprO/OprP family phosphate-selective porin [Kordiimonas sp.]|uniref:OprO/OprP family phosphate-selective porin n=1 Tax=Kordiimonas sp. TaxID=1970157 RepID=UPI003A92C6FD